MRDARVADWLRRLQARQDDWQTKLHRFAIADLPSVGTLEAPILSPLTVLAGPNGVGKTTLLRAIWSSLSPEDAAPIISSAGILTAGTALVDLSVGGAAETAAVNFTPDEIQPLTRTTVPVCHVDSAAQTPMHQKSFRAFKSAEEIVNGAGASALDDRALAEVSYILHRAYRTVTLYEVEVDGVAPFFEVKYGDDQYDSRTMGAGEMSALYIWWAIQRADSNSILLIEEPEAFLSFGCQISLANFLVSKIVDKNLVVLISSHSSAFISLLPKSSIIFLTRGQTGVEVLPDRPPPVLLKSLGIDIPILGIVFVEDDIARVLPKLY